MRSLPLVALLVACSHATVPFEDAAVVEGDGPIILPDSAPTTLVSSRQHCKLLSDRNMSDPTANDVQHGANVHGADLGIPVVHADTLYILFGDTIGFNGIWGGGESHPDSIGYGVDPASVIAAQPELLCNRMKMVTLPASESIGPQRDPAIVADFAGVAMIAPSGQQLGTYIRNPSGRAPNTFPHLPGDFEVPSGAFAHGGSIYVFYTTVVGPGDVSMKASYLARWTTPAKTGAPLYQILYPVDQRFDANGPLGGRFINVAAEVHGEYVYLFGTGELRRSTIHVARKRLDALATPGGFEELGEIVATPGYGEVSVRYFPSIERWVLLAEELTPTSNRIVARTARRPEGPWGEDVIVHDMGDPVFRAAYCCGAECAGEQMFDCARTGFYGTYMLPAIRETPGTFTVAYTMSSFVPYNVGLFEATFTK